MQDATDTWAGILVPYGLEAGQGVGKYPEPVVLCERGENRLGGNQILAPHSTPLRDVLFHCGEKSLQLRRVALWGDDGNGVGDLSRPLGGST